MRIQKHQSYTRLGRLENGAVSYSYSTQTAGVINDVFQFVAPRRDFLPTFFIAMELTIRVKIQESLLKSAGTKPAILQLSYERWKGSTHKSTVREETVIETSINQNQHRSYFWKQMRCVGPKKGPSSHRMKIIKSMICTPVTKITGKSQCQGIFCTEQVL